LEEVLGRTCDECFPSDTSIYMVRLQGTMNESL